MREELYYIF